MVGLLGCGCCGGGGGGGPCQNGYVEEFAYAFDTLPSDLQFIPQFPPAYRPSFSITSGDWSLDGGRLRSAATSAGYISNRGVICQFQTYSLGSVAPFRKLEVSVDYEIQELPINTAAINQIQLFLWERDNNGSPKNSIPVLVQISTARYTFNGPVENTAFFIGTILGGNPSIQNPALSGNVTITLQQLSPGSTSWESIAVLNGVEFSRRGYLTPPGQFGAGISCDYIVAVVHQSYRFGLTSTLPSNVSAWFDNFTQTFTPQ